MRTLGIDPGTVSIDICGLHDGAVFLDRSIPTAEAVADVAGFVELLAGAGAALIAGPSGYGLPLMPVERVSDEMLRLAFLAPAGENGGIMGMRSLVRALASAKLPVVLTPGVVHLPSVPAHRKINRVDMGTADKVCATALAIHRQAERRGCALSEVSFILLELGGAFSAAIAVSEGRIVDGMGGTAGPLGARAAGALDGEVAFLAGHVSKSLLFQGGVSSILGDSDDPRERLTEPSSERERLARAAFVESAAKAVAALTISVPHPYEILLSGRMARGGDGSGSIERELGVRLAPIAPVRRLDGVARVSKEAAQGAALIANGLAGGACEPLVATLGIREAAGTVLDHLYVVSPDAARHTLGID